ncbi:hypothetical protein LJC07_04520 [Christensenellaceae bacterium OttesenSCG-928-L17]|nr:hypothetical protein [Christensenellaceae bacterium OttesenSCG-928-L17]
MVDVTILIAVIGVCLSIGTFLAGRKSAGKQEGLESGTVLTEIGYIKSGIDDIKRKQDRQEAQHLEVIARLTAVEASAKQAHKRMDDHIKKDI